jgi:molybdenum cofactor cytidylyltransferase
VTPDLIGAIVLAAGLSSRMGQPKMTLPWGETTVIGRVVDVLAEAGSSEIIVVTGGAHTEVVEVLRGREVHTIFNPKYQSGEMLDSIQVGMSVLGKDVGAAVIALGDQPQIQVGVVRSVIRRYQSKKPALVIPSFEMRRGHPWLVERSLWQEILDLDSFQTMRDFIEHNRQRIDYVNVDTPSVLQDLDTPEDYERHKPK